MNRMRRTGLWMLALSVPLILGGLEIGSCGLNQEDFTIIASGGIDDRLNGYPWAVEQYDGDGDGTPEIYVGTVKNPLCLQVWIGANPNSPPATRWQCRNDLWGDWPAYLLGSSSPGHVYRGTYDEPNDAWGWERVFSPSTFETLGFRGARVFNDALYMLGTTLTGGIVWKTTDGETYEKACPSDMAVGGFGVAGGLRGAQVFDGKLYVANNGICEIYSSADPSTDPNSWDNACSLGFIASGAGVYSETIVGSVNRADATTVVDPNLEMQPLAFAGETIEVTSTADPNVVQQREIFVNTDDAVLVLVPFDPIPDPCDTFEIVATDVPENGGFWQLGVFDGHLYAGCGGRSGPELWKSDDPAPGNWTRVIEGGYGNDSAHGFMTLREFGGYLYIGTVVYPPAATSLQGCDILRIDADDNVDLLVGNTRDPNGPDPIVSLSGMDGGFDYWANVYCWYMAEHDGWLYVGTYDMAGQLIDPLEQYVGWPIEYWPEEYLVGMEDLFGTDRLRWGGSDFWRTKDGVNWVPINLDGFGDRDNYGIRNLLSTQWGLLAGSGNAVDGFELRMGRQE